MVVISYLPLNSPLPVCLSACLSVCLSACLPARLSVRLFVCPSVCVSQPHGVDGRVDILLIEIDTNWYIYMNIYITNYVKVQFALVYVRTKLPAVPALYQFTAPSIIHSHGDVRFTS